MNKSLFIFNQLLAKDILIFFRGLGDKFINLVILLTLQVIVFGFFMPDVQNDYALFILVGAIASFGFFEIVGKVGVLIADINGDRTINHKLLLPIDTYLVFVSQATSWAIESTIINVLLFPVGKMLLFYTFDITGISYIKLIPIIVVSNLFFGFFALWITSMLPGGMRGLQHLWIRFISPLYFFGCYFYPWRSAYQLSPFIGYASLLNPKVYIMEGTRSAVLGPTGYLPYGFCFIALIAFTSFFGFWAIRRLKIQLDVL